MIALRVIHILSGIYWVGVTMFLVMVLIPAGRRLGRESTQVLGPIYSSGVFGMAFSISSLATTVAGFLLLYEVSDRFNADWMGSDNGVVLSTGATAGILAFGHGLMAISKYTRQFATAYKSSADRAVLAKAEEKIARNSYISLGLMIVAVIGMSAARYV